MKKVSIQANRKQLLDGYVSTYRRSSPYDDCLRDFTFKTFIPFMNIKNASALELGCSDGKMTHQISKHVNNLDVVDGSKKFIAEAKKIKSKNIQYHLSLFEDFKSKKKYDYIFATYILTHIPDLSIFFKNVFSLLKEDGLLFIAVPNSRVLSRQLALNMDLLKGLMHLSENDLNHGHCRAYDRVTLNKDIKHNSFKTISQGGIILKPLADFQMDELMRRGILKEAQLNGLYKLGFEYPDLSASIYSVCKKNKS